MATGRDFDVIVAGAGIFGLACARACLQAGLSVLVLERDRIGTGASGGVVGAMAPHVPEGWSAMKQFQLEALLSAEKYWLSVDGTSGIDSGYGRIGRLQPLADAQSNIQALRRVAGAQRHWGNHATWSVEETGKTAAIKAPFGVIRDSLSARIQPWTACLSLAQAIRFQGGVIEEGMEVTAFREGLVETSAGSRTCGAVILAAGHDSFAMLAPFVGIGTGVGVKGQALLVAPDKPFTGAMIQTGGLYIVPHADGSVAIGSTSEDHWTDGLTDAKLDLLLARARDLCPALSDAKILTLWSGIRPKARGRGPMVGRIPETKSLFVATGGFKTAFGIAHEVGFGLAQMIAGNSANFPASFSPGYHRVPG